MQKNDLRRKLKNARASLRDREEKNKAIAKAVLELADAFDTIFCYVSMGSEADTRGILTALPAEKRILVPYTDGDKRMHAALPKRPFAFDEIDSVGNIPVESQNFCDGQADLILVPLLGFDAAGYRIGYGAGCYDRYFAAYPRGLKVGLAYEEQFCSFIRDCTDVPLDTIITPERIIERS